jgi:hypothetical protein
LGDKEKNSLLITHYLLLITPYFLLGCYLLPSAFSRRELKNLIKSKEDTALW